MSDTIVLSKIAKLANETEYNNDKAFVYKNKKLILLPEFEADASNIFDLLRRADIYGREEIAFISNGEDQHLVIIYKNRVRNITETFIEDLFAAVYPNYKKLFSSPRIENAASNTYETTKLFSALQLKHNENFKFELQHSLTLPSNFLPNLREYQKRSVLWLLKREADQESFPPFFEKLLAKDNQTVVYKHLYSRYMQKEPPDYITLPPGGILADEMGLGKTVEMLALILLHSRPEIGLNTSLEKFFLTLNAKRRRVEEKMFCVCNSNSKTNIIQCQKCFLWQHKNCTTFYNPEMDTKVYKAYVCPYCWQNVIEDYGLWKTKATFIVSPNTIKMQWASEIKQHIKPTLRVFLYGGILSGKWISPQQLAEYDIVLTDYNILRGDFYYTQNNTNNRSTRNKPRCMRVHTPILMLDWWRVVIDEAQMVESKRSKVAELVRMIPAINRWAVTGTPIQKSLNDLQPLLQFIGFEAASEPLVWHQIVNDFVKQTHLDDEKKITTCPAMINILEKCMWRTCKSQVTSELDIPPQREVVHRIEFDNLEKLFYDEQHAQCRSKFLENVSKYRHRMSTISPQIMNTILHPFLKIRYTCNIPLVQSTSTTNNFHSQQQNKFLKPQELNEYLRSTNEISCKSELRAMASSHNDLRAMASSHNGLAALHFLKKEFNLAIKNYEAVLKLANDYSDMNIGVDSLLQIHALHNIMQTKIIQSKTSIENLKSCEKLYNQLEWKYLSTYANALATARNAYEAAIEKVNSNISEDFIICMAEGLETLAINDEIILIQKIQGEYSPLFREDNRDMKLSEIQSARTLLYVVQLWFNKLIHIFKKLQNDIEQLKYFTENVRSRIQVSPDIWRDIMQLVNSVYDCHLSEIRNIQKTKKEVQKQPKISEEKKLCKMCCIRDSINAFECLLFNKVLDKNTNYTEGLEYPSFEMNICKLAFHYIKSKHRTFSGIMEKNWLYLENLQLVCKRLIKFWIEMEYTIKAYDELNMCKMRITITEDAEDKSIFKIRKNEVEGSLMQQQNELMNAQNQFRIKLARLKYIKHLEGNDDPGACPICHLNEDDKYAVLECGHHICFPCLKSIRIYTKGSHFKCSICRNMQQNQKIYYVSRAKNKNADKENIKGHYSSKISCIVRLILKLKRQHTEEYQSVAGFENNIIGENDVKILIFSQWKPIIQAIALALNENGIKYRAQCTPQTIDDFKNPKLGITCLLMPFIRGSKGLNLVEATHVFLVEPILNPGEELQAIGRVHRFGQKRETTVHRFIVNKTIEENIYNFIISSSSNSNSTTGIQSKWEFENISLKDFENLFSLPQSDECD